MNPRTRRGRLLALVLRPVAPPLWLGIVVAVGLIVAETVLVYFLKQIAPLNAFGAVFLLGVLVVSAGWGFPLAVATSFLSAGAYMYFHFEPAGRLVPTTAQDVMAICVFLPVALLANVLAGQARLRAAEANHRRLVVEKRNAEISVLARRQAALRRVATAVAQGTSADAVFQVVVTELAEALDVRNAGLFRYEDDDTCVLVAVRTEIVDADSRVGEKIPLDGRNIAVTIRATGESARMDGIDTQSGAVTDRMRLLGLRSAVGAPIVTDGRVWGVAMIGTTAADVMAADTEARVGEFADLVATAIANAEARAALTASRSRIVTAADNARRRIERDLHDGAQQRLVTAGLLLRNLEASVPDELPAVRDQISRIVDDLVGVSDELREISRGIHPAILSKGGLGPALRTLARRSAVPVDLDLAIERRMPESVEVAAYYVVAEALTNAAKHASATSVTVHGSDADGRLRLCVHDDGDGGADTGNGSGLIGLVDRVEALGGQLRLSSPPGTGTTLEIVLPL